MTCWTLNREYCLDSNFSLTLYLWDCNEVSTTFCQGSKEKKKQMFVVAGLLNVKTVDERCIRSAFYTTTSFGHQGKSIMPVGTTIQHYKHMQSVFDLNWIHSTRICIYWNYCVLTLNCSLILFSSSFICDNCLKTSGKTRKENKFSARRKLHVLV